MDTSLATDIEKDPDHAVVTAAKRGDTHAFEKLMLRHKRKVFAIALRITKNREDAEDVMQEVFFQVWQNPQAFVPRRGSLAAWLLVVTRNQIGRAHV